MKKLLLWAVLCTACTSFAMDQLSFEPFPASPGKALSEEDLKSLLSVTNANSPEEPRSASSSPIPLDPSQEQSTDYSNATEELRNLSLHSQDTTVLVSKSPSPKPVKSVEEFQSQFTQWINSENILAFRGFLKEHYTDAEKYISSEIVELALRKKESTDSDKATEIHSLLSHLKSGKDNHFGDMEKIWHHTFYGELKGDDACEASMLVIDKRDCARLSHDHSEPELESTPITFVQQKSAINIVLRDLIEQQKLDEIFDLVYELTKYDNCDLDDVISDKTRDVAYQNMLSKQTRTSETIYCIINEQTDDISASEFDTTAESLKRVFTTELDKIKLSKNGEHKMAESKLLTCIENIDFKNIDRLLSSYKGDAQAAKDISHDILKTAEIMRDRVFDLQQLMYDPLTGERIAHNAAEVCRRLYQTVYNPVPVTYILSDEEETGPVYSEGELDAQRVLERVRNAFSLSTLESIVGSEKTEKIIQLLEQEKKRKKQGELDWVSPQSSPSEGLREYLGSFKSESLSD